MTYKHEYESEDTEKLIHSWFILSFCSLEQPSAREYQCVSTVCTLNGYEMSDTIDTNWSWLNIVIIIRNNKKGSFAWSKGKESLPSLPKLTQGVKEMFPRCDGRSGVVKCSLAISLGRPGEPRVIGRSSKVSLKERMLGKIIVPKIFEKRWTIDATNPNMSKSLTFQCVRSHEVIFNPNEGLCPKAILEWIQWIGLSLIQPHLLCASECLLLLPAQWRNNSLSLFCNVGFAHVCRSPPRRWRRPIVWTSAVLVARLRAVSQPVSRRLHLPPLWQEQALSTCAAVEQPDSVPEPRHCRSRLLAGLRQHPPWISCSVGERAPHRYLRLSTKPAAGTGSCVKPQRRGRGVDSRDLDPALGNLPRPCASLWWLKRCSGGASSGLTTAEVDSSAGRSFVKGTKTGCEFFSKYCLFVVRLVSVKKWKARPGFRVRKTCDCQDVSHDLQLHPGQARVRARPWRAPVDALCRGADLPGQRAQLQQRQDRPLRRPPGTVRWGLRGEPANVQRWIPQNLFEEMQKWNWWWIHE